MNTKVCSKCKIDKPISDFAKRADRRSGVQSACKSCCNKLYYKPRWEDEDKRQQMLTYSKQYCADNKERRSADRVPYNYGLTKQELQNMRDKANGKCAICGLEAKLNVDHCHTTLKVRGLLCKSCNFGLGNFKDDPILMKKAIEYLELGYSRHRN